MNEINKNAIKRQRIKICSMKDFKTAVKKEGYNLNTYSSKEISTLFYKDESIAESLKKYLNNEEITFKVSNIKDLMDYVHKINLFEKYNKILWNKIKNIKKFIIKREEYERKPYVPDNVEHIKEILNNRSFTSVKMQDNENIKIIRELEAEIESSHVYSKDIELLKNMIFSDKSYVQEEYNIETCIKTKSIEIPQNSSTDYIKSQRGSVEYHNHLNDSIPRMKRLIKNIDRYLNKSSEKNVYIINQSSTLQDSINIAAAVFNSRVFKAVSGKNDIENYCKAPAKENEAFESCRINKKGQMGVGYKRVNDSEKKIFEEIHRLILNNEIEDEGKLILYSKWQPCSSCYYVIEQFCRKHPKINIIIKYEKEYACAH